LQLHSSSIDDDSVNSGEAIHRAVLEAEGTVVGGAIEKRRRRDLM
jgi:hypothetical protein